MAALAGNFLFVTNVGNQAALPLVLQDPLNTVAEPFALCVAGQPVLQALHFWRGTWRDCPTLSGILI